MLQLQACSWILELCPFSPEGLSGFSISGKLEDSVLAVGQKASRKKERQKWGKELIHYQIDVSLGEVKM